MVVATLKTRKKGERMKREFLEQLGLEKDVVEKIIIEHGKSVQSAKPSDYDELKAKATEYTTTIQSLQEQIASEKEKYEGFETEKTELAEKVKGYELKELKLKVARENNIPFDLAQRLSGTNEEELSADAKSLASFVNQKEVLPLKQVEQGKNEDSAYANMLEQLED